MNRKNSVISGENVTKKYGNRTILNNIKITIDPGCSATFIGPSGCGKSTLLKLLANVESPTSGKILWWGLDSKVLGSPGRRISMVFQEATLMPWSNVITNVSLPLELEGVTKDEAREAARAALQMVSLGGKEELFPRELSGGMQMRVSIARALITKPNILFMDEPFGALDEITRDKLNEDVLKLKSELDMTLIFVTHSLQEAAFMSDIVYVLKNTEIYEKISLVKPDQFWFNGDEYRVTETFFEHVKKLSTSLRK